MDSKSWGERVTHNHNLSSSGRKKKNNNYFNFTQIAPCPPSTHPTHKTPRLCHNTNHRTRRYDENCHPSNALQLDTGGVEVLQETAKLALTSFTNHLLMKFHANNRKTKPKDTIVNKTPTKEQSKPISNVSSHFIPTTNQTQLYETTPKQTNPLCSSNTSIRFSQSISSNLQPPQLKSFSSSVTSSTKPHTTTSSFILPGDPRWIDRHNLPSSDEPPNPLTRTVASERSATPSSVWTATHSARRRIMEARLNDIQERLQTLESNWFNHNVMSPSSYLQVQSDNDSRRTTEASLIFDFQEQNPNEENKMEVLTELHQEVPMLISTNSNRQIQSFDVTRPKPESQDIYEGSHHPKSIFKPLATRAPMNFKPIETTSSPPILHVQQITPVPVSTNIIEEPNPTTSTVTSPCSEVAQDPFPEESNVSHIRLGGASRKIGLVHTNSSSSNGSYKESNISQPKIPLPDPRRPSVAVNNITVSSPRSNSIILDDMQYILKVVVLQISGPIPRSESTYVRLILFDEMHRTDVDDGEGQFPFWNQEFTFKLPQMVHKSSNLRIEIVDDEEILGKCSFDSSSLQTSTTELKLPIIWEPDIQCGECYIHLMATFTANESPSKTYDKRNSTFVTGKQNDNNGHKPSTDNIWNLVPSYRLGHSPSITEISDQST
eukprot:NODE_732_length_2409_cov_43.052493_g628_i0.p1 GENE.NODE_732_length_2409_cov_43.052493_g628_i0~~NODE_732_length_2409_cov_43.052493_g628_i0.p1  ORF type:complete len:661 (+),score=113.90 NODE_732_length_2409_cov_43.052493_g628_i0:39-2021(+)